MFKSITQNEETSLRQNVPMTKPNLSLYSPYYAEAGNEFAVPNPRHSADATKLLA